MAVHEGEGRVPLPLYTGLIARRLLARCSPGLLARSPGRPSPLSLTPLLAGGSKPLYPRLVDGRVETPYLSGEARLSFEAGYRWLDPEAHTRLLECLERGVTLEVAGQPVAFQLLEAKRIAVYEEDGDPLIDASRLESLELTLVSPTLPLNPWKPGSRWKRLIPAPSYLFAANILDYTGGRPSLLQPLAALIDSSLEPIHVQASVEMVVVNERLTEPGLRGRLVLRVEPPRGLEDILSRVLSYAALLGLGASRSIGMGYTRIQVFEQLHAPV